MNKSLIALRKCAEWLCYCLKIGWHKTDLDNLSEIWWKYHDYKTGEIKKVEAGK